MPSSSGVPDTHSNFHIITNQDGSRTVTYGVWILVRLYKNGRVKQIMSDAPRMMMQTAYETIGLDPKDA